MSSRNIFRVAAIHRESTVHGPGARYVIWLQGCDKRCPGCIAPEWQPMAGGMPVDVGKLAGDILARPHLSGVTISGGEPLLQSGPLVALLTILRMQRQDLSVILFTGYTMGQLVLGGTDDQRRVLSMCDLVIDGPYIESLNDDKGLRGSSNQVLHFITDALRPYKTELETSPPQG